MRYRYCPLCGNKVTQIKAGDDGYVPYCTQCEKRWFDTFSNCVLVLVVNEENEIALLWQRHLTMRYGTVVSGFMTPGETAEETAYREVKEELGIDIHHLEYSGTFWYDRGDMLMHGFIGYAEKQDIRCSQEVVDARWVPLIEADHLMPPDSPVNFSRVLLRKFQAKTHKE